MSEKMPKKEGGENKERKIIEAVRKSKIAATFGIAFLVLLGKVSDANADVNKIVLEALQVKGGENATENADINIHKEALKNSLIKRGVILPDSEINAAVAKASAKVNSVLEEVYGSGNGSTIEASSGDLGNE